MHLKFYVLIGYRNYIATNVIYTHAENKAWTQGGDTTQHHLALWTYQILAQLQILSN